MQARRTNTRAKKEHAPTKHTCQRGTRVKEPHVPKRPTCLRSTRVQEEHLLSRCTRCKGLRAQYVDFPSARMHTTDMCKPHTLAKLRTRFSHSIAHVTRTCALRTADTQGPWPTRSYKSTTLASIRASLLVNLRAKALRPQHQFLAEHRWQPTESINYQLLSILQR